MEGLIISDEVRELMPTAVLARVIAHREHTEVVCSVCGGHVQPDNPAPMSVVVRFDAVSGRPVTQYAHAGCSPSMVDPRPVRLVGNDRLTYLTLLRQRP